MKKFFHLVGMSKAVVALENSLPDTFLEMKLYPNAVKTAMSEVDNAEFVLDRIRAHIAILLDEKKTTVTRSPFRNE